MIEFDVGIMAKMGSKKSIDRKTNGEVYCKKFSADNSKYQPIEVHEYNTQTTNGQVIKLFH